MSFASRESFVGPCTRPPLSRKQLLEKVLESVRASDGLAHDSFGGDKNEGLACSLGNAVRMFGKLDVEGQDAQDIAAANDSYPESSPRMRRILMIEWLHEELQKLPVTAYFARPA